MTEIIDHEPDPENAKRSRLSHLATLADTIVQALNDTPECWEIVKDGNGFNDVAAEKHQQYATYKLALALIAGSRLQAIGKLLEAVREKLLLLQDESGGWVTDYDRDAKRIGVANVETSCLAILGLEEFAKLRASK